MQKYFLYGLIVALLSLNSANASVGIAMFGEPKYKEGFKHFEYVNPDAPKEGDIKFGVIGTFDNLNPFILKGIAATGSDLVFETLLEKSKDEPFSAYGLIAEDISIAPDKSSVTFKIRKEAKWEDGTQLTPDDVIFSFNILKEKGHPAYRSYYKDVANAEKVGNHSVRFNIANKENRELPLILGDLPVLSKKFFETNDFTKTTMQRVMGSGPYRVEKADAGRSITYVRRDDYWGKDLPVQKGRYNFRTITYDYYRDETVAVQAIKAGSYDMRLENIARVWSTAYEVPAVKAGMLKKEVIEHQVPSGMQAFIINNRREKFSDINTRKALSLAFDYEWANKNLFYGLYNRMKSFYTNSVFASSGLPQGKELEILEKYKDKIPPEIFAEEYKNPETDGTGNNRENLKKASELLANAGWVLKNGKLYDKNGNHFSIEFLIDSPVFERVFSNYVKNLAILGITANIRNVDSAQFQKRLEEFDFDITVRVFPQSLSPGNEQIDYWHSSRADVKGSRNLAGIKNPVIDELVNKIITAKDYDTLLASTHALDRVLLFNHYVIPNWQSKFWRIVYWDRFGRPQVPAKYDLGFVDTWWIESDKDARIQEYLKRK